MMMVTKIIANTDVPDTRPSFLHVLTQLILTTTEVTYYVPILKARLRCGCVFLPKIMYLAKLKF